jgi:carbonic anhydrase
MDFRFGNALKAYLEKNGLMDNCDIVSIAGAAKNIASPAQDSDRELALRQIEISKRLHHIHDVILMNHTDCGAYGGRAAFASREDENKKHAEDLASAKKSVLEKFPDLNVKTVIAQIEPDGAIHIEPVAA